MDGSEENENCWVVSWLMTVVGCCLQAVRNTWHALEHAPANLRADRAVVLEAGKGECVGHQATILQASQSCESLYLDDQWSMSEWVVCLGRSASSIFTALEFMHRPFLIKSLYLFSWRLQGQTMSFRIYLTDTLMHLFHPKFGCVRGGASTPCCFALGLPQCAEWWGACFWLSQRFQDETAIAVKINYYNYYRFIINCEL